MRITKLFATFLIISLLTLGSIGLTVSRAYRKGRAVEMSAEEDTTVDRTPTRLADRYFYKWYEEMTWWAKDRPKVTTDEGEEIPFDASMFFKMKYLESVENGMDPFTFGEVGTEGETEETPSAISTDARADSRAWSRTNTGEHCKIYVERGSEPFNSLKTEFDNVIWPSDTEAFGTVGFDIDIYVYYRDGNNPESDGAGGVGGFFYGGYPKRVYVDSADISGWGFEILAHEFQHLIHHNKDPYEDLWVNEGAADYAIIKTYGQNAGGVSSHLRYFEQYPDNDLTQFDNQPYDYGSCGAFITYLVDQYGGNTFSKALVSNSGRGFSGITSTLSSLGYSVNAVEAYLNWLVANYLDDVQIYEGHYGYSNLNIKVKLEDSYSSYPVSDSGSVHSWGADYYRFRNGGEGVGIEFTGKGGGNDFAGWVLKMGSGETVVEELGLDSQDKALHPLRGFGTTYSTVILVVTADSDEYYDFGITPMDTTPPSTDLSIDPSTPDGDNGFYVTQPVVTLTASEPESTTIYYLNDNADDKTTYERSFTLPEGPTTLSYYSVDPSNNKEQEKERSFKIDLTPPTTDYEISPEDPNGPLYNDWYVTEPDITLFSEEEDVALFYRWDVGEEVSTEGEVEVPEGEHNLTWWGIDPAGNVEGSHTTVIRVDTTSPTTISEVVSNEMANEEEGWYNDTVVIELSADENGVDTFYAWDGEESKLYRNPIEAEEGEHILYFYSVDRAGNREKKNTRFIKMDATPAESAVSITPEHPDGDNGFYTSLPNINITSNEEDAEIYFYWDDQNPIKYDPYSQKTYVREGRHTLYHYAVDRANNQGDVLSIEVAVDLTAPSTNVRKEPLTPSGEDDWHNSITLTLSGNDNDLRTIYYYFDNDRNKREYGNPLTAEDIKDGRRTLYYYSVDLAGNSEDTNELSFKLDTSPPKAILRVRPTDVREGERVFFSGGSSEDNIGVKYYKFKFGDGAQSPWGTEKNRTHVYEDPGTYSIALWVKDESGIESELYRNEITIEEEESGGLDLLGGNHGRLVIIVLAIVSAAVLILAVLFLIRRRRRRRKAEEGTMQSSEDEERERAREKMVEAERLYGKRPRSTRQEHGDRGSEERGERKELTTFDLEGAGNRVGESEPGRGDTANLFLDVDLYGKDDLYLPGPSGEGETESDGEEIDWDTSVEYFEGEGDGDADGQGEREEHLGATDLEGWEL